MRLLAAAVALVVPFLTYGFTPTTPSLQRAPGSSLPLRCPSCRFNTIMNNLDSTHAKIKVAGTVLLGGALLATGLVDSAGVARADLSISPRCITGEGANCDDLAEGNELIKSLQAKSVLSKDKFFKETLEKYNEHNFKDYFRAENKHMVRHKDGRYEILTNADYDEAEKAGKVKKDVFLE
ncbi:unnamed protein product [Ascophyllum nodosum]